MKSFGKFCNVVCTIVLFVLFAVAALCVVKTKLDALESVKTPGIINSILDIPSSKLMYQILLYAALGAAGFSLFSIFFLKMFGFIRTLLAGGIAGFVYLIMRGKLEIDGSLKAALSGSGAGDLSNIFMVFGIACIVVAIVSLIGTAVVKKKSDIY